MPDTIHVANATRYNIWVQCDSDRNIITEASQKISDSYSEEYKKMFSHEDSGSAGAKMGNFLGGVEVSASGRHSESSHNEHGDSKSSEKQWAFKQIMLNIAKSKGLSLIRSEEYLPFAATGQPVFVTIYIESRANQFESVVTALPIADDRSIIVRHDGQVHLQKYGGDLFTDENGVDLKAGLHQNISMREITFGIMGNNGKFVCGENGQAPVMCNRDSLQEWESFSLENLGNGKVAFKCMGKYLCSENGEYPINCNRLVRDVWEIFEWIDNGDGTFSLKGNNGKYVSSENGEGPMTCNRDWIQSWEKFQRING